MANNDNRNQSQDSKSKSPKSPRQSDQDKGRARDQKSDQMHQSGSDDRTRQQQGSQQPRSPERK